MLRILTVMFIKCLKDTRLTPSSEPPIDAVPIPVDFRQGPPSRPLFGDPGDCREKAATGFGVTDIDVWRSLEKRQDAFPSGITDRIREEF